jgi:hypothetical protein
LFRVVEGVHIGEPEPVILPDQFAPSLPTPYVRTRSLLSGTSHRPANQGNAGHRGNIPVLPSTLVSVQTGVVKPIETVRSITPNVFADPKTEPLPVDHDLDPGTALSLVRKCRDTIDTTRKRTTDGKEHSIKVIKWPTTISGKPHADATFSIGFIGPLAPVVYANNTVSRCFSVLRMTPGLWPDVRSAIWQRYEAFSRWFDGTQLPHVNYDRDVDHPVWKARFPPRVQAVYDGLPLDCDHDTAESKSFIKIERLALPYGEAYTKKPRNIQACQPKYNDIVGPFMLKATGALHNAWPVIGADGCPPPYSYSCGATPDVLGDWADSVVGMRCFIENDFSSFDASISLPHIRLENEAFGTMGASTVHVDGTEETLVEFLNRHTTSKIRMGRGSNSIAVDVPGGRKSGQPHTSLGNSIVNAKVVTFGILAATNGVDFKNQPIPGHMLVLGDDNLIATNVNVNLDAAANAMRVLGFQPKLKSHDSIDDAEFCSSVFWRTKNGRSLGPKIGRVIAKTGHCTNPPYGPDHPNFPLFSAILTSGTYRSIALVSPATPFIKEMVSAADRHLECLKSDKPSVEVAVDRYRNLEGYGFSRHFAGVVPSHRTFDEETVQHVCSRYGITTEQCHGFAATIQSAASLPFRLACPVAQRIIAEDIGVHDDLLSSSIASETPG